MTDPITIAVLGAAFTESIKFLYGQASDLLKARRERRSTADAEPITSTIPESAPLDSVPISLVADMAILDERSEHLADLANRLAPVAQGWHDPNGEEESVASELRAVLEAVYGQRLTFVGEHREPTGTRITVQQVVADIESGGKLVGAETMGAHGDIEVGQYINRLSGNATGYIDGRGPNS